MLTSTRTPRFEKQKRRDVRHKVGLEGVIRLPNGQMTMCEVRDISRGGAMLHLSVVDLLPEEFALEIPGNTSSAPLPARAARRRERRREVCLLATDGGLRNPALEKFSCK